MHSIAHCPQRLSARIPTFVLCALGPTAIAPALCAQSTVCVSVNAGGSTGNGITNDVALSGDGRFAAFSSWATDLVPNDTNNFEDVFVRDLDTGTIELVSKSTAGVIGDAFSINEAISVDGRYVAFGSAAHNLVATPVTAFQVYLRDRQAGTTTLVSLNTSGGPIQWTSGAGFGGVGISRDGRYVLFEASPDGIVPGDANGKMDVFVRDRQLGTTSGASQKNGGGFGNGDAGWSSISDDGRYVAFASVASDLVPNDTNGWKDVFLRDRVAGTTQLLSTGAQGIGDDDSDTPSVSGDGRYVYFASAASNLYFGDPGGWWDIFRFDVQANSLQAIGVGGWKAYDTVSPKTSRDGRFLVYTTPSGIFPGDTNNLSDAIYLDLFGGGGIASIGANWIVGNNATYTPVISDDGRRIAFVSEASNLVSGDANALGDAFVHDRGGPTPTVYCTAGTSSTGCVPSIGWTGTTSLSDGARFTITASNLNNNKSCLVFYSTNPSYQFVPFLGGTLCMGTFVHRCPTTTSGGTPPPTQDCSGQLAFDFENYLASGGDPSLGPLSHAYAQIWIRDPGHPLKSILSNAIHFALQP